MDIDEHISQLISSYISRSASDEELSELYSWLEESEENCKYFSEIISISSLSRTFNDSALEDRRGQMLLRLNSRIDAQEIIPVRKSHIFKHLLFGIAASTVFIAGLFITHNKLNNKPVDISSSVLSYQNTSSDITTYELEDGTIVFLTPNSHIDYHLDHHDGVSHRVADIQGKAYFDVKKDSSSPFIVNSGDLLVRVLGTRFIVESHPDSSTIQILLEQGSVRLQTPEGENLVRLSKNQKATYTRNDRELDVETVEVASYVLDNFKRISFRQITIEDLILELQKLYHVELYTDQEYDDTRYEINIYRDNTLSDVLDIIDVLTGVRLRQRIE